MSNKEKCLRLIEGFTEEQLANVAVMLESAKTMADEAADEAYCMRLYAEYQTHPDRDKGMPVEELAEKLGIAL